jgi:hypothetical protein
VLVGLIALATALLGAQALQGGRCEGLHGPGGVGCLSQCLTLIPVRWTGRGRRGSHSCHLAACAMPSPLFCYLCPGTPGRHQQARCAGPGPAAPRPL